MPLLDPKTSDKPDELRDLTLVTRRDANTYLVGVIRNYKMVIEGPPASNILEALQLPFDDVSLTLFEVIRTQMDQREDGEVDDDAEYVEAKDDTRSAAEHGREDVTDDSGVKIDGAEIGGRHTAGLPTVELMMVRRVVRTRTMDYTARRRTQHRFGEGSRLSTDKLE